MKALERPETLTSATARHIREAIVAGDYEPGTPLPELLLAERLGISRGTVREALLMLVDSGLVEVQPHRGTLVSKVTPSKAKELFEVRALLEAYVVRRDLETQSLSGERRRLLAEALRRLVAAADTGDLMARINAERTLHREFWCHCDNETLRALVDNFDQQTRRLLFYHRAFRQDATNEISEHRLLVKTVLAGNPEVAAAAMRDHILQSGQLALADMKIEADASHLRTHPARARLSRRDGDPALVDGSASQDTHQLRARTSRVGRARSSKL